LRAFYVLWVLHFGIIVLKYIMSKKSKLTIHNDAGRTVEDYAKLLGETPERINQILGQYRYEKKFFRNEKYRQDEQKYGGELATAIQYYGCNWLHWEMNSHRGGKGNNGKKRNYTLSSAKSFGNTKDNGPVK
jgi:hypothetical protein